MSEMNMTAEEAIDQIYKYGGKILCKDVGEMAAQAAKAKLIFGKAKQLMQYGKDVMNVISMLKDYVAGNYTEVPWRIVAALSGAIVYVFSPVDFIPDLIPLFGFTDDATVFASVMSLARIDINSYLAWKLSKGGQIDGGSTECVADTSSVDKPEDITDWSLKNFPDVVHAALNVLQDSVHWFWGEENIAQYRDNIYQEIMGGKGSIDEILGVIDTEAFGRCKEGFVFTPDRIYFRQFAGYSFSYRWRDIIDFSREGTKFYINGTPIDNICSDELVAEQIYKTIKAIINRADLTPEHRPVDETLRRSASQIAHDVFFSVPKGDYIFVGDNIPEKKRVNAHQAMEIQEPATAITVLIDGSLFGSGKDGVALTNRALYGKCFGSRTRISWSDLLCVVKTESGNLAARTFDGDYILYTGVPDSLKDIVCEALNNLKSKIEAEPSRQITAKMKQWHIEELAMAERFLNRVRGASEKEEDYIKAGYAARQKIVEDTTVLAQTEKQKKYGCERIVNNVPLAGGWKISGKKVYLEEVITISAAVSLFIEDAEIHFGSNAWFALDGCSADFKNCRFVCDSVASADSACVGLNMFCGKVSTCYFQNCEIDGLEARSAFSLDGDVRMIRCLLRNLYNNRQGSAVLGTSYQEGSQSKLSLIECSVENCKATSQSIVWAMEAYASNCEFVKCSSPSAMIVVNEDSELGVNNCVFDQCIIGSGGAVISLYSQKGSGMVEGEGVYTCWLKDCSYQYTHNIGIPINSLKGWVDEISYMENVAGSHPFFLRDGTLPKERIGADLAFGQDVCVEEIVPERPAKIGRKGNKKTETNSGDVRHSVKSNRVTEKEVDSDVTSEEVKAKFVKRKSAKRGDVCKDDSASCESVEVDEVKGKKNRSGGKIKDEKMIAQVERPKDIQLKRKSTRRKTKSSSNEKSKLSVSDAVDAALSELGNAGFYVGTGIPQKKLNNAVASMGIRVGEDVLALIDTTFFGSAKTGLVITNTGFHWKNDWTTDSQKSYYSWEEFSGVCPGMKVQGQFELVFEEGSIFNTAGGGVTPKKLMSVLSKIDELIS